MTELTITQTSQKYHLKPATLRYYEQIGLLPDVRYMKLVRSKKKNLILISIEF